MANPLHADCDKCADLCCVAYAFDAGQGFGHDKETDSVCSNLKPVSGCRIHDDLSGQGFRGCVRYDCSGAGVRVTQEMFRGRSWRDDPALLGPMCAALRALAPAHEQAGLLDQALSLDLPKDVSERCAQLRDRLLGCPIAQAHDLVIEAKAMLSTLGQFLSRE